MGAAFRVCLRQGVHLLGVASLVGACASAPSADPSEVAGTEAVATVLVDGRKGTVDPKPLTIGKNTEKVRLTIRLGAVPEGARKRIKVARSLASPGLSGLRVELRDLPIKLPTRQIEGELWEIEFPPNVLQLLSTGSAVSSYEGQLVLKSGARKVPLELVIARRSVAEPKIAPAG